MKFSKQQCLEILELESGATRKQLKSAFRREAMRTHPDKDGVREDFIIVKAAYDFLVKHGTRLPKPKTKPSPVSEYDFSQSGFSGFSGFGVYYDHMPFHVNCRCNVNVTVD